MWTLSKHSGSSLQHWSDGMKSSVSTNLGSIFTWGFAVSLGTGFQNEEEWSWGVRGGVCVCVCVCVLCEEWQAWGGWYQVARQ